MRILHVASHLDELGDGIANSTVDLACLLAQRHDVAVAARGGAYVPLLEKYGAAHAELRTSRSPLLLPRSIGRFRKIAKAFAPQIVHAHTMIGAVVAAGARFGLKYRIVTTVHNEFQRSSILMGLGDAVTANSVAVGEAMRRRGIPAGKLHVVSIGALDGPRRRSAFDESIADLQHPAIVTVAGLFHRKGIDVLISAFEAIPDAPNAHLYIVGEGPDRAAFEEQARRSPAAARIHFAGFEKKPERYMRAADVFVLASRSEPFGMVLSEAREAGCAIVASNVGGIPEALDSGAAGILVPPADPAALSEALGLLLRDPAVREAYRARAREGLAAFSAQRYSDDIERIYATLLAK